MSDQKRLSLKDYMHEVRRHLSRHCVSLSYVHSDHPSPEHWKYGTGFLLKVDDQPVVVTAGHLAAEVFTFKKDGKLAEFHVTYTHVSNDLTSASFRSDEITEENFVTAPDFDAALFRLPVELAAEIARQGNHFFTMAEFMRGITTVPHLALVSGYPVQANIITKSEAFLTKQAGRWFQYNQVKLGSLAFQSTLVTRLGEENAILPEGFDCEIDEHAFRPFFGNINSNPESGVTSAVGMSGGPVVAIVVDADNPDTFFQPRLLGMQASQKYIEWQERIEITELTAVSSAKLQKWIEATFTAQI